jgi:protein involved in polysaccharide export with SLBB domain
MMFIVGGVSAGITAADNAPNSVATTAPSATSEYRLFPRDLVRVTVHGEPELKDLDRRIDGGGRVSLPFISPVEIQGLTTAEAEMRIQRDYIDQQILIRPQVSVTVVEYDTREVSVLGQVRTPGRIAFPKEATNLSIIDAVSKAGGFTRIARTDSVRVTRKNGVNSTETSVTVDVARMFDGRGGGTPFLLLPGDIVFVPERIF